MFQHFGLSDALSPSACGQLRQIKSNCLAWRQPIWRSRSDRAVRPQRGACANQHRLRVPRAPTTFSLVFFPSLHLLHSIIHCPLYGGTPALTPLSLDPMAASGSAILSLPDPIVFPPNISCAILLGLCSGRNVRLPAQRTVANMTKLASTYNANVEAGGDFTLKLMLQMSIDNVDGEGDTLRQRLCARVKRFHRSFAMEQRSDASLRA